LELAIVFEGGTHEGGLGHGEARFRLLDFGLVRRRFDDEEQVSLFDDIAVLKLDAGEIALDAAHQRHLLEGLGIAGELDIFRHRFLYRLTDGNLGWWWWDILVFMLATIGAQRQGQAHQQQLPDRQPTGRDRGLNPPFPPFHARYPPTSREPGTECPASPVLAARRPPVSKGCPSWYAFPWSPWCRRG